MHIQVKTYVPGGRSVAVGKKAEMHYGAQFFWVLAGIPLKDSDERPEFYVIPSNAMAKNITEGHKAWLDSPGRKGQARNNSNIRVVYLPPKKTNIGWCVAKYKNNWERLDRKLSA